MSPQMFPQMSRSPQMSPRRSSHRSLRRFQEPPRSTALAKTLHRPYPYWVNLAANGSVQKGRSPMIPRLLLSTYRDNELSKSKLAALITPTLCSQPSCTAFEMYKTHTYICIEHVHNLCTHESVWPQNSKSSPFAAKTTLQWRVAVKASKWASRKPNFADFTTIEEDHATVDRHAGMHIQY